MDRGIEAGDDVGPLGLVAPGVGQPLRGFDDEFGVESLA
jgi:hypothetical protein